MADRGWNPWKMTTIGLGLVAATAVITGVVVANRSGRDVQGKTATPSVSTPPVTARPSAPVPVAQPAAPPSPATIAACNQQAAAQSREGSNTREIVIDGAIGAAAGAVVGAAGGAIVDGGSGAGKGAAIGGILGAGAGALYGVNENRKNEAQYRDAYASCLRSRGYIG